MRLFLVLIFVCAFGDLNVVSADDKENSDLFVVVLGVAQDAGYPQAGCKKKCCVAAWMDPTLRKYATSLAVVDKQSGQRFLFDCTPDFREQLRLLDNIAPTDSQKHLDGVLLTHAHVGHYAGLIHLGREIIGADGIKTHCTQVMGQFLRTNGPWSQLVKLNNIDLNTIKPDEPFKLNDRITVTAFKVPHRDEFSDTVGFKIVSPNKSVVYLPDIDKWSKWSRSIEDVIRSVDVAYLDGSFFANGELPGRDMSQIPHPFVEESIARFSALSAADRNKIRFIHLNHTNPAINNHGDPKLNAAARQVEQAGMRLAKQGEVVDLLD